jgi:hypothetical protein
MCAKTTNFTVKSNYHDTATIITVTSLVILSFGLLLLWLGDRLSYGFDLQMMLGYQLLYMSGISIFIAGLGGLFVALVTRLKC